MKDKHREKAKEIVKCHREVSPTCSLVFTEAAIAHALAQAESSGEINKSRENCATCYRQGMLRAAEIAVEASGDNVMGRMIAETIRKAAEKGSGG